MNFEINPQAPNDKNIVELKYRELCERTMEEGNPFEFEEFTKLYNAFCEKYMEPLWATDHDKGNEFHEEFIEVVYIKQEKAFQVGFAEGIKASRLIEEMAGGSDAD